VISVVLVTNDTLTISHYATSFFQFQENQIIELNEYWGENGTPPQWRIELIKNLK
jgi:hypothetical protein